MVEIDPDSMTAVGGEFGGYRLTKERQRCDSRPSLVPPAISEKPPVSEVIWHVPPPGQSTPAFGLWSEVAYRQGEALLGTEPGPTAPPPPPYIKAVFEDEEA